MRQKTSAARGEFRLVHIRRYFATCRACMSVTRCTAHSGQPGASVGVTKEKTETL